MSDPFDPYYIWLGIPPAEQPPNLYRLLGLQLYEHNLDVITHAADRLMMHVRTFQAGPNAAHTQKLLNEISNARVTLLDPSRKAAYDNQLRAVVSQRGTNASPPHEEEVVLLERDDTYVHAGPPPVDLNHDYGNYAAAPLPGPATAYSGYANANAAGPTIAGPQFQRPRTLPRRSPKNLVFVVIFAVVGVPIGLMLGWLIVSSLGLTTDQQTARRRNAPQRQRPTIPTPIPSIVIETPSVEDFAPSAPKAPAWWDSQLTANVELARNRVEGFDELYPSLISASSNERAAAYEQFVELQKETHQHISDGQAMIAASLLAQEPNAASADRFHSRLLAMLDAGKDGLPRDVSVYDDAFWALRVMIDAMKHGRASPGRKERLQSSLSQAVGFSVDLKQSHGELYAACEPALARQLYDRLIAHVESDRKHARTCRDKIAFHMRRYGRSQAVARLDADFIYAMLPIEEDDWKWSHSIISQIFVFGRDPDVILRMVDVYEATENKGIEDYLATRLRSHVRGRIDTTSKEEFARDVRERLAVMAAMQEGRNR